VESALALAPDAHFVHFANGDVLLVEQEPEQAEAAYQRGLSKKADVGEGHRRLAEALRRQGKAEEAVAELREVIRINPNHYNAHYNLGEMFRLEGKYDESARQFREYLRLAPDDSPANRRNISRAKSLVEKFEDQ
jgi:tetratricopeptide (TPR) repeat protein